MPRPRIPDQIHDIKGTRQPCRHGRKGDKDKFVMQAGIPECPSFLFGPAREEWARITAILAPLNVLTVGDLAGLAQYAALYGEFATSPHEFQAGKHTQLRMLLQEFGLTPASRHKVSPVETEKGSDPWDEIGQSH